MALMPKRVKHRKSQRGRIKGEAHRGNRVVFGDFGLISQLGNADYARPRKFREKLEGWLDLVRTMWRECPASIDKDGTGLFVDRANAVLPTGGTDAHN